MGEPLSNQFSPHILSVLQPIYAIARMVENPSSAPPLRMMAPLNQLANLLSASQL